MERQCKAFQQHFSCIVKLFSKGIKWEWSDLVKQQEKCKVKSVIVTSPIKPLSKSSHTIWCERSHHLIRALTPYDVSAHIIWCEMTFSAFRKDFWQLKNNLVQNAKHITPDGIVPEEFKLPSFLTSSLFCPIRLRVLKISELRTPIGWLRVTHWRTGRKLNFYRTPWIGFLSVLCTLFFSR